jgi:hypothetical protein
MDQVGKYQLYEVSLIAGRSIDNPFDSYLLKIELMSPSGRKIIIDGFFDGDGKGGQHGKVWKARVCPDEAGLWSWKTIQAGNDSRPEQVNSLSRELYKSETIPHLSEEFGFLNADDDNLLRAKLWANFCGGSAGGGTGNGIKALLNFIKVSRIPFYRMKPNNDLVDGGGEERFCLAEEGKNYLIYSLGGSFQVKNKNVLNAYWYNPRSPGERLSQRFVLRPYQNNVEPPFEKEKDWVLWITNGKELSEPTLYPSKKLDVVTYGSRAERSLVQKN